MPKIKQINSHTYTRRTKWKSFRLSLNTLLLEVFVCRLKCITVTCTWLKTRMGQSLSICGSTTFARLCGLLQKDSLVINMNKYDLFWRCILLYALEAEQDIFIELFMHPHFSARSSLFFFFLFFVLSRKRISSDGTQYTPSLLFIVS